MKVLVSSPLSQLPVAGVAGTEAAVDVALVRMRSLMSLLPFLQPVG